MFDKYSRAEGVSTRKMKKVLATLGVEVSKLEAAGYIEMVKDFVDKKPHTMLQLPEKGREAFREYCQNVKCVLDSLPG